MSIASERLESVKSEIRSLLVSNSAGMTVSQFLKDYNEIIGKTLPFRFFGFKTPLEFLQSLGDVLQIKNSSSGSFLVPVECKKVSHINSLVSKQKNVTKKRNVMCRSSTKGRQRYGHASNYRATKNAFANLNICNENSTFDSSDSDDSEGFEIVCSKGSESEKTESSNSNETETYRAFATPSQSICDVEENYQTSYSSKLDVDFEDNSICSKAWTSQEKMVDSLYRGLTSETHCQKRLFEKR